MPEKCNFRDLILHSVVICGPESPKRDGGTKTTLVNSTDGYPFGQVLLYSDGADVIISWRNTNEESHPDFALFPKAVCTGQQLTECTCAVEVQMTPLLYVHYPSYLLHC